MECKTYHGYNITADEIAEAFGLAGKEKEKWWHRTPYPRNHKINHGQLGDTFLELASDIEGGQVRFCYISEDEIRDTLHIWKNCSIGFDILYTVYPYEFTLRVSWDEDAS